MSPDGFAEAPGYLEIWDIRNERVGDRHPCRYAWRVDGVSAAFRILAPQSIELAGLGEAATVVVTDENGRVFWAHPVIGGPAGAGRLVFAQAAASV